MDKYALQPTRYVPALTIALLTCWALIGPLAIGQAQTGNPQIDQYTENVPDSGGGQPTGGNGGADGDSGGGGGSDEPVLEPEQRSELEDLGEDGAGVADLTEDTSPDAGGAGGSGGGGDGSGDRERSSDQAPSDQAFSDQAPSQPATGGSFGSSPSSGSDGDDGLGVLLPLIVGALALGGLGVAAWRRRAAGTPA